MRNVQTVMRNVQRHRRRVAFRFFKKPSPSRATVFDISGGRRPPLKVLVHQHHGGFVDIHQIEGDPGVSDLTRGD
jgi:hypothetical protein